MKKLMTLGILLCLLVTTVFTPTGFAAFDPTKPLVGLVAGDDIQELEAGSKGTYELTLKNASSIYAKNVRVTVQGSHPFRSEIGNLTSSIAYINPNQEVKMPLTVNVAPIAESKIYEFEVLIEYSNMDDESFTRTEKAYVKIVNKNIEPIVGIVEAKSSTSPIKNDEPNAVMINIVNKGTIPAKDLRVKVSGFSNQGLILYKDVDTKTLESLDAKATKLLYFNVIPGADAISGTSPLTVSISYIDDFGGKYTKDYIVYMTLAGKSEASSSLEIQNLTIPSSVNAGEDFTVSFDVVNTGKSNVAAAEITYEYPSNFIAKSNSIVYIKNLAAGEKKSITINMMAKKDTPTESYHTYVNCSYKTLSSDTTGITIKDYAGIYVKGESEGGEGSKPKLIIENYSYGGDNVLAGENYILDLFIKNTSNVSGTRNIKVTVSSEDNVFTPVDSSSSFFIPAIGPGEVYNHKIQLKTKIDANVKIYTITTKMAYEDSKGNAYDANKNPYEESETLSIAVAQPVRLETAEMIVPFETFTGQPFYIEQEFYNMGKSTMYNMMVRLEGFETSEGTYFVGNMEAGRSDRFSAQIFANEPGVLEGKLIYTFEDALGSISTVEHPVTVTVSEMTFPDGNWEEPVIDPEIPQEKGGISKYAPLLIGLAVVLAIVVFLFLRRRKKLRLAKELEALDE